MNHSKRIYGFDENHSTYEHEYNPDYEQWQKHILKYFKYDEPRGNQLEIISKIDNALENCNVDEFFTPLFSFDTEFIKVLRRNKNILSEYFKEALSDDLRNYLYGDT